MPFGSLFLHVSVCYLLTSYPDITLSTLGTRGFFSLATGSFVSSVAGRHVFGQRPKTRAAKRESLFKTSPKPETAHEKPLAPRVHFVLQYAEKWDRQIVCQTTPPPPLIFRFCFLIIRFRSCFCDVDWWIGLRSIWRLSETSVEKRNIHWWLIRK